MTVVNFGLTGHREAEDPLAASSSHGELVEEFVDPPAPVRGQGSDRPGEVLAVVVGCVQRHPLAELGRRGLLVRMERAGIEPATSALQRRRSPS